MIEIGRDRRVLKVTLNRPEKRNALNLDLCAQLVRVFDDAGEDPSVGAMLLTANGPVFSAGMDLKESIEVDQSLLAATHERLFTTIQRIRKPLIAAVHGAALAGGAGLVANAHIVIAGENVRFALTEIRVGLWPVLIFRAIAQAIGERRAVELSLTGREFSSEEALRYGLVTEIAADPIARALEIATALSELSPIAIGAGLDYVHQIRGLAWEEAGLVGRQVRDRVLAGKDFKEGVRAFLEKRKPSWPSLKPQ